MMDGRSDGGEAKAGGAKIRWTQWGILGVVCVLVIGVYARMASSGPLEAVCPDASDTYYNLLVRGFRAGQLSLKKDAPPGLVQLADPYEPAANARYQDFPYRLADLTYYKGKLYLYFGITPALLLFWPFVTLTGHYLLHKQAVMIFCAAGFLVNVGLLRALWLRYFGEVNIGVVALCALALGLAAGVPTILSWSDVYEVPISCGYMLTILALAAIWCAVHEPKKRSGWSIAASVAYGLAVGARPNLLPGAVILLVPVVMARRERQPIAALVIATTVPMMVIGLGLMSYNVMRFDNPFEFGLHYQLSGKHEVARRFFDLNYLWFNFRIYFLQVAHWNARFPFVNEISVPPMPSGYARVEAPYGVLTNIPLVWLALAAPLAWRNRSAEAAAMLRGFVTAIALLFGTCALTLGVFEGGIYRYEMDFLPSLMLLAVVGVFGLDRMLADRPFWRRMARCGWGLLLVFSVAFNVFFDIANYAKCQYYIGTTLARNGRTPEAIGYFERALRSKPDYAEAHSNLGLALQQQGRIEEAIGHYEQAIRIRPDKALVYYNLGGALMQAGRAQEAIAQWEQAVRIKPDFAEADCNLGMALEQEGKTQEAIQHFERALQINPDFVQAQQELARLRAAQ